MQINTVFQSGTLSVTDYRCSAVPGDKPYKNLDMLDPDDNNVEAVCLSEEK